MTDHIALTGNITSTPERVDIGNGVIVAKFGLACTERRLRDGVWVDVHTNFYNVSVYRRLAEHALASFAQGQRIVVIGLLKVRKWDNGTSHGTAVDLEATSIGHDLMFGTTIFRPDRPAEAAPAPAPAPSDAGAAPRTDANGWAIPQSGSAASDTAASDTSTTQAPPPSQTPALVGAPAGGLAGESDGGSDETPF